MTASSHVSVGILSWAVYESLTGGVLANYEVYFYFLAALGSLLPDIDHPQSWIGSRFVPISFPIWAVFGHRGITHSLIAIVSLVLILAFYQQSMVIAGYDWLLPLMIGYLSHLFADYLSNSGIPLFYPSKRKFRAPITVQTGGVSEYLLVYAMVVAFAFFLLFVQQEHQALSIENVYKGFENMLP